jgi:GINS complex subunit 2
MSKVLLDMYVVAPPSDAQTLTISASDDLQSPATLRSLLKDLREVRQAKIRLGLHSEGVMRGSYLQVTNLTPIELAELKPFLVKAMGIMQSLEPKGQPEGDSQM